VPPLVAEQFSQLRRRFVGAALPERRVALAFGLVHGCQVEFGFDGRLVDADIGEGLDVEFFPLCLPNTAKTGVAGLVNPRLDRQHGRQLEFGELLDAALEFASHGGDAVVEVVFEVVDDGAPLEAEVLGDGNAGRGEAVVAGLNAGEHEVGILRFDDGAEDLRLGVDIEQVDALEGVVPDADGAVGTLCEGLADGLFALFRTDGSGDDFVGDAVFLELDGLFDRVVVPLIEIGTEVLVSDFGSLDFELVFDGRYLFDRNENFHREIHRSSIVKDSYLDGPPVGIAGRQRGLNLDEQWEVRVTVK